MNKKFLILSLLGSIWYGASSAMLKNELALASKAIAGSKTQLISRTENEKSTHLFSTLQTSKKKLKKEKSKNKIACKDKTITQWSEVKNKFSNNLTQSSYRHSYENKITQIKKTCTEKMHRLMTISSNLQKLMKNKLKTFTREEHNQELHMENMILISNEFEKAVQDNIKQFSNEKIQQKLSG